MDSFGEGSTKKAFGKKRKSRYARRLITASALALVLVLNIVFSLLAHDHLIFTDISDTKYIADDTTMYTMSDGFVSLVKDKVIREIDVINKERGTTGDDRLKLKIIFCADADLVEGDQYLRYANYTARSLEHEFPDHISVEYINVSKNPSAVQKYKVNSAQTIYSSNVIVEFGSEFANLAYKSFFTADSDEDTPWAYNGEKRFATTMISLTRAEAPIMCITTNHDEEIYLENGEVAEEYTEFIKVIEAAGYIPMPLDLEHDEIPENCRMILTFNPKEDFKAFGNLSESGVSEIEKLDKFIDNAYNFMYVCDRDTPYLENLEEYLEEWGICVARRENLAGELENLVVRDATMNVDANGGDNMVAKYETSGKGASLVKDLTSLSYPPKAVFSNSTYIGISENYNKTYILASESSSGEAFDYYQYFKNGVSRSLYNIFTTYDTAASYLGGEVYEMATSEKRFSLMTITHETRNIQEDSYNSVDDASYVMACSSTDFFKNSSLESSAYGNTDVILSVLRQTGREIIPVNLGFKAFYDHEMTNKTVLTANADKYIAVLAIVPALVIFTCGIVVNVKRKHK